MMGCDEARERMSLRLDGRLAPAEDEELSRHLLTCPACAGEWLRWQELDVLLRTAPVVAPPEHLMAGVMTRLRRQRARQIGGGLVVIGLQACALGMVALGWLVYCLYWLAPVVSQVPYLVPVGRFAAEHLLRVLGIVAEATGVLLKAALASRSALVALAYALLAGSLAAAWLWVVLRARPLHGNRMGA
jgi:anti-sigma factor RsiW